MALFNEICAPEKLTILKAARNLIATTHQWTRGATKIIRSDGTQAYCLMGAVNEAQRRCGLLIPPHHMNWYLCQRLGSCWPENFNDSHEHGEVLEFLDECIALLAKQLSTQALEQKAI